MKKVAIYTRVSTKFQSVENQIADLTLIAQRNNWEIVNIFKDEGISGVRATRPSYNEMMKGVVRKDFDIIMAWDVGRLGRSLQNLVVFFNDISAKNIDLYIHTQGIDTTMPSGKAIFQMCGAFAEFEYVMNSERIISGQQRAKANGTKLGRKPITNYKKRRILKLRKEGNSMGSIAKTLSIGSATVHRTLKEYEVP